MRSSPDRQSGFSLRQSRVLRDPAVPPRHGLRLLRHGKPETRFRAGFLLSRLLRTSAEPPRPRPTERSTAATRLISSAASRTSRR